MAYKFNFDLSKLSQSFFIDIAKFANRRDVPKRIGKTARYLVKKFKINEITGLPMSDALQVVEDLIDINVKNLSQRDKFLKTKRRALFLPHCSRKYMDSRCQAVFDKKFSSYKCAHCSKDCLVNKATQLGEKKGYDVYILPGGSCIRKILSKRKYSGIVGVACCEEIELAINHLANSGIKLQGVPLIKNGCSGTKFSLKNLQKVL
ncbi:MAG: DUF116 domain-containing protein [Candidatus Aenigmarchaeota archaeon]|nr:DUF116 domain-containing protein [Candidatus Aenigmarchaeota archaeon]